MWLPEDLEDTPFIANISLYALRWPKLDFGFYLTFEIIL
jgi:hypothetical protein